MFFRLVLILLMFASVITHAAEPCPSDLALFSFEKIISEYAELIYAAEQTPADSPASELIRSSLEAKGVEISSMVSEKDHDLVKKMLAHKLVVIREASGQVIFEKESAEASQREEEEALFYLRFSSQGKDVITRLRKAAPLSSGVLSPDGKTFFVVQDAPRKKNKKRISLVSLASGKFILEKEIHFDRLKGVNFSKDGSYLKIEYVLPKFFIGILFNVDEIPDINTVELFETKTGKQIFLKRKGYLVRESRRRILRVEVSPDDDKVLVFRAEKIEVIDLTSGQKFLFKPKKDRKFKNAFFDESGKNIVLEEGECIYARNRVRSVSIVDQKPNWDKEGAELNVIDQGKYFLVSRPGNPGTSLVDGKTGEPLATFLLGRLDSFGSATLNSDGTMVFIPGRDNGFIYTLGNKEFAVKIQLPPAGLTSMRFLRDNKKIVGISDGKVYAWNVENGSAVSINGAEDRKWAFGLNDDETLIGTKTGSTWLQAWPRETSALEEP